MLHTVLYSRRGVPESWRMRRQRPFCFLPVCLMLACLIEVCRLVFPCMVEASPPKEFAVYDPAIETLSGEITARLGLSVDSVRGMQLMLKDGAIMELTVDAKLERLRGLWLNATLAEKKFTSMVRHNPLTREFYLTMPGEETPIVDKSLQRLLAATWHKLRLPIAPVTLLDEDSPGTQYALVLKLSLRHVEVPPWLSNTYLFWSWNVVEPMTLTLPFIRQM